MFSSRCAGGKRQSTKTMALMPAMAAMVATDAGVSGSQREDCCGGVYISDMKIKPPSKDSPRIVDGTSRAHCGSGRR